MKRRLFNLSAALSLAPCLATVILCVRSYFATDVVRFQPKIDYVLHQYAAASGKGYVGFAVAIARQSTPVLGWEVSAPRSMSGTGRNCVFHFLGVLVESDVSRVMINRPVRNVYVYLPCRMPVVVLGLLPALWLRQHRKCRIVEQRLTAGACTECGYGLRATPDRCPECGAEAKPRTAEGAAA